jgi:hypothetical protein
MASDVPSFAPLYEPCNICGEGYYVSNDEGELVLLTGGGNMEPLTCGFANQGGIEGLLSPEVCDSLQNQTSPLRVTGNDTKATNPCGCLAGTMPPTPETCHVCGDVNERVTRRDDIVKIPQEVLDTLPNASNVSPDLFTCAFVEKNFNTTLEPIVCEFLQMNVADTCDCQVLPNTTIAPIPSSLSNVTIAPLPSPTSADTVSLASIVPSQQWNVGIVTFALLYFGLC